MAPWYHWGVVKRKRLLPPPKVPTPKSIEDDRDAALRFRELADRFTAKLRAGRPTPRLRKR